LQCLVNPFHRLVSTLDRLDVQLDAQAIQRMEVSTMAKKDDGHKEIKKGKESER
jgi:hypothetical protein